MWLPFAWNGTREVNKETEQDKKGKRVLGVAAANVGEREVGGSRSTACVHINCQNLSILLGKEAAMGQGTHMPDICLCMPSPSKGTDCSGLSKYSKTRGEKVVKANMHQQPQQNALCHPWKQPLLAASVVGFNMAVVWEEEEKEEGTAKKLGILVCL